MKSMIAMTAALLATAVTVSAQTLDADGDGSVSFEEMLAVYPDTTAETFATIDTDADGMVSEAELTAAVEAGLVPANG